MINPILIRIPAALASAKATFAAIPTNATLFDTSEVGILGDWLVIYPDNGGYQAIYQEFASDGEDFALGITGNVYLKTKVFQYGFTIQTDDSREALSQMIVAIAQHQGSINRLMTVLDFCKPELSDLAQGYTTRTMRLTELPAPAGSIRHDPASTANTWRYNGGCQFQMFEPSPRVLI